jgi:pimeloyl-ACP methyl ester carboxylesterase
VQSPNDAHKVYDRAPDIRSSATPLRRAPASPGQSTTAGTSGRDQRSQRPIDSLSVVAVTIGSSLSAVGSFGRVVAVLAIGGVALLVYRSAAPGWKALALALLGAVAASSGAAMAVSQLRTTESPVRLVGAALAVAGGIVALVSAIGWMTAAVHRWWWRALSLTLAVIAGYVVFMPLGIAVYATNPPRASVGTQTPADRGLEYRDAEFSTSDGTSLAGWYIRSATGAAVVLIPGSGSSRTAVLDHAVVLSRHGYGVLLIDPRGHGNSDGQAMEFGWFGDQDVAAAVSFLTHEPDVDSARIAVVGLSMGGEEAIGAIAADPRIRAVVAEGATQRVWQDRAWLAEAYGLRGRLQIGVDAITYGLTDILTAAGPPSPLGDAVAAAAPRPILLIAAGDAPDEINAARAIQHRSPATVFLWTVPRAGHTRGLTTEPAEWERRVTEFLSAALTPNPTR